MGRKIKIAEVITRLDWGGAPDIVRLICSLLDSNEFDIYLITGDSAHLSLVTQEFLSRFENRVINISELKRKINPLDEIKALIKLYNLFRRERFDIVHTHTAKAGVLGRLAAKLAKVPNVIHTTHGHNFYGYFNPIASKVVVHLERWLAGYTDKILSLTELEKEDLIAYKVSQADKISVINSGLEMEKFTNAGVDGMKKRSDFRLAEDEVLVGMIGRLEPIKGPGYFVEAAKIVLDNVKKVRFLVAGEGSLKEKLEAQTRELNIADKFIFTGWSEDIPQILKILDLLVLPSLNEAVGRILLEAGACGVPVVATKVGGIPEVVKDDQTGLLVPPRDPAALASGIIKLLKDENKRKTAGKEASRWVDEKFSAQRMVQSISHLYRELMTR